MKPKNITMPTGKVSSYVFAASLTALAGQVGVAGSFDLPQFRTGIKVLKFAWTCQIIETTAPQGALQPEQITKQWIEASIVNSGIMGPIPLTTPLENVLGFSGVSNGSILRYTNPGEYFPEIETANYLRINANLDNYDIATAVNARFGFFIQIQQL